MTKTFQRSPRPTSSMWGAVQGAEELAPGIWAVSTAGHGGIVVSAERLAAMPADMRRTAYSENGQFEEDCDWCLPVLVFGDELAKHRSAALATARVFHPEIAKRYEA